MRTKVKIAEATTALERLLNALENELIEASDEEIMQAAKDLGMNPFMKGSAAFAWVTFPVKPRRADFFDLDMGAELPGVLQSAARLNSKDAGEK
jgi:hypothetical protein